MHRSRTLVQHLIATLTMGAGALGVFLVVFVMNKDRPPPEKEKGLQAVEFKVEQKKPPKKKQRQKPRPKPKAKPRTTPAARAPNLAANISGASFSMGGLEGLSLGAVSADVVGTFSKDGAMTADAVDEPAKALRRVRAAYPAEARKRGVEGYVLINFEVMADGRVGRMKVLDASPKGTFDDAAKQALSEWEFQPAQYQNQAQTTWMKQKIVFKLQKS